MPRFGSAALDRCTAEPQEHGEGNVRPRPSRSSVKCGAVHDACPANRITHRTAEYGSVHAVVWEGRRREAPPIPISQTQSDRLLGRPSLRTFHRKMSARAPDPCHAENRTIKSSAIRTYRTAILRKRLVRKSGRVVSSANSAYLFAFFRYSFALLSRRSRLAPKRITPTRATSVLQINSEDACPRAPAGLALRPWWPLARSASLARREPRAAMAAGRSAAIYLGNG
jgi:hypothetical protein